MQKRIWIACLLLIAPFAWADDPDPSVCLMVTCYYDIPDETAPHKGVVEIESTCQGIEWGGTLEITKICSPSIPCVNTSTSDPDWSIGPGFETRSTELDCTDPECCSRSRSAPQGPYVMPMDFSATLTVDEFSTALVSGQPIQPVVIRCSRSGNRTNTNKCPPDEG